MGRLRRGLIVGAVLALLNLVAAVLTVQAWLTESLFGQEVAATTKIALVGLLVLGVVSMATALVYYIRAKKFSGYAPALANMGLALTHVAFPPDVPPSGEVIKTSLTKACDSIAAAFKQATGRECSVCIKMLVEPPAQKTPKTGRLKTLCRDSKSDLARGGRDVQAQVAHTILNNTDFREIFEAWEKGNHLVWLENDLVSLQNYENSSFQVPAVGYPKNHPKHRLWVVGPWLRSRDWTLGYRSVVTAAIVSPHKGGGYDHIAGFLCIDSPDRGTFSPESDREIVARLASALYPATYHAGKFIIGTGNT